MKKFKFTLESVHNVREMREETEKVELSRLKAEAKKAAEKIEELEELKNEAIRKYNLRLQSGTQINVYELEMNSNHITHLDRLKKEAHGILAQKNLECTKQVEKLTSANREVKITDRLRENQEKKHKSEAERHDQNAIDELVSANFARRMAQ